MEVEPPGFPAGQQRTITANPASDAVIHFPLPSGTPPFQFEWSRAGASLDDRFTSSDDAGGVRLTVTSARAGDSGVYTLQASNAAGKDTARVRLEVSQDEAPTGDDPPDFLRRLQDLTVKVGTRTRFLVEIVSSTECKVTWFRNERRLMEAERVSLVRDGNFWCADVATVSVDDAGRWTCTAENIGGRASCSAHLNVLVPKAYKRPEFVEELKALLTEQGTVSLECKVVGVPTPVLRWFKDSREIKAGDVFALTASAEDPTSLGTYTCEAVNCMGRAYSSSKVHVVGRPSRESLDRPSSSDMTPDPPPIFTKELEDHFVKICEPLTLSCNIVVPPWPRSVVWYNKEGKVEASERYHVLEDGVGGYLLEMPSAEWPDEGEWKCVATTTGGRVGISSCYISMDVPKNYRKPRFMENLQAVLTEEGLVSFECKVVGFPTPVLSWFKDGQELKPGDVYQLTGTNSLGSYCCIARNCMGKASSSAELTVEDIQNQLNEEEKLQLFSKNQAPKFVQGLKSVEAKIDEPFRFTIKVAIPPEPSVLWYRDDQPVDESTRCRLTKEDRGSFNLDIQTLELFDQAEWKCVAMNDFGHSVTSCFLKLIIPRHYKKPRFLENLQAILSDEGAVNLECKVIGVPQPVLKWYKDGEELKPGDIHRIISGQDGTCCLGTYTCEAQNCMGIAASSASLLGFDDSMKAKSTKKAEEQALQRNLSLSTIHEERTSQMYDTPLGDITLDDKGEISFSFDGKEVSVSLYETPDLTEEEALQIVEMYADQLSENVTEHNVVELPPLRFVKETSTSGNLLMEAIIIDVSPEYFASPEEDLRTEADIEDISIADENGPLQLSLDQDLGGEDYLEKTMALLSDEKADLPKKMQRKKSDSQRSGEDFFSLSRDQSLSDDKKDDDTQILSESFASARSIGKVKSKSSKPSLNDGHESSKKTTLFKDDVAKRNEPEPPVLKPKRERRSSRSSRRSSSGSEKSLVKSKEDTNELKIDDIQSPELVSISDEDFNMCITNISSSISEIINDIQIIERDIILKSELMSSAATASRSLEILSNLVKSLTEIISNTFSTDKTPMESTNIIESLNNLLQPLKTLLQSLTIVEKCIDVESENKTLVKKTCVAFIEASGEKLKNCLSGLSNITDKVNLPMEQKILSEINVVVNDISNVIKFSVDTIKAGKLLNEASEIRTEEPSIEINHLRGTQKALFELRSPLNSLLCIVDTAESEKVTDICKVKRSEVILNDMSASIQDLQTALESIESLSVGETNTLLNKYNTKIIETVMESVLKLRNSFEQLSSETKHEENKTLLRLVLNSIRENLKEITYNLDPIENEVGAYDILLSENKLEVLQKMAQILISLENSIPHLETMPEIKDGIDLFHKNLTRVLENVIESNDAKKYFTLMEVCDAVNRMNTSIQSITSDKLLSLASLSNTFRVIQQIFVKNVFDSEINCTVLTNITETFICIEEVINRAEEISENLDSENIQEINPVPRKVQKPNVIIEDIEHTIAVINTVILAETTKQLSFKLIPVLENICPVLEELKRTIGGLKCDDIYEDEKISEISDFSAVQTLATPLLELNQNLLTLNQILIENLDSFKEDTTVKSAVAEPLHELYNTLQTLQQDVLSQYDENITPYDVSVNIASAVQNLQSCILMIEEHQSVEGVDEMSTLEDISGIKTTAENILSDYLVLPAGEEVAVQQSIENFDLDLAESVTARALHTLNDHIAILHNPDVIDALDTLSELSDLASLKSITMGLGELHSGINQILHPVIMESSAELPHLLDSAQLTVIAEPMQDLYHSMSIIDLSNIPVYEHILEISTDTVNYVIQSLNECKEYLGRCIEVVLPALETADKTIEISQKVDILRKVCEQLKDILQNEKPSPEYCPEELANLEITVNNLLDATNVNNRIQIGNVKSMTEQLYGQVVNIREDLIQFTPSSSSSKLIDEARLIETIQEIENEIAALEQYDFVDLSNVSNLTSCATPQLAVEVETDSLSQIDGILQNAVDIVQDSSQELPMADLMTFEDFFTTCKNEFKIIRNIIENSLSHKKVIRLIQEFYNLNILIAEFKRNQGKLQLSENINDCLMVFFVQSQANLSTIQSSLLKIKESYSDVLFVKPLAKLEDSSVFIQSILSNEPPLYLREILTTYIHISELSQLMLKNIEQDVTNEIIGTDLKRQEDDGVLIIETNLFMKLIDETLIYKLEENKYKKNLTSLLSCLQKHQHYNDAVGAGKFLIILKCLSECADIIKCIYDENEENIVSENCLRIEKEITLKEEVSAILKPLQEMRNHIERVQEKMSLGTDDNAISADLASTETLVEEVAEKHKIITQKLESYDSNNREISIILETDKEIRAIQESLKEMNNMPEVKDLDKMSKSLKEVEKSLQSVITTEKDESLIGDKLGLAKGKCIIVSHHIDQYIDVLQYCEEANVLQDVAKHSLSAAHAVRQIMVPDEGEVLGTEENVQAITYLKEAISALEGQILDISEETSQKLDMKKLDAIKKAISDLKINLTELTVKATETVQKSILSDETTVDIIATTDTSKDDSDSHLLSVPLTVVDMEQVVEVIDKICESVLISDDLRHNTTSGEVDIVTIAQVSKDTSNVIGSTACTKQQTDVQELVTVTGALRQSIENFISEETDDIVDELATVVKTVELNSSFNLAKDILQRIVLLEKTATNESSSFEEIISELKTNLQDLPQQLNTLLIVIQKQLVENCEKLTPFHIPKGQQLADITSNLQRSIDKVITTLFTTRDSISVPTIDDITVASSVLKEILETNESNELYELVLGEVVAETQAHDDNSANLLQISNEPVSSQSEISIESKETLMGNASADGAEVEINQSKQTDYTKNIELNDFNQHMEEFLSNDFSETIENLSETGTNDYKETMDIVKQLRESLSVSAPVTIENSVQLQPVTQYEATILREKLSEALSHLLSNVLESTKEMIPYSQTDKVEKISEAIIHLQEDLNDLPCVSEFSSGPRSGATQEESMSQLRNLLQEVSSGIDLSTTDRSNENTEMLRNSLDEVQTVIIKLKRDFDGVANDTLNETLEDLECSVRSVQLQINEDSPPNLLKEACATLQLLVENINENQDTKYIDPGSVSIKEKDILMKCSTDFDQTVQLLEQATDSNIVDERNLKGIISSLQYLRNAMSVLKSNFSGSSDKLIDEGIDIIQSIDQVEEKIFSLEKDISSEVAFSQDVKDNITMAVHSVYGSVSNMRSTILSIQKQYMYTNYGEPSESLLRSMKYLNSIQKFDDDENQKVAWRTLSKSLRNVLNHFEDIKFYINFDKTARLPSDAAFTSIILNELKNNLLCIECSSLNLKIKKITRNNLNILQSIIDSVESRPTLEVKEKIPIMKVISTNISNLTKTLILQENIKHKIEGEPLCDIQLNKEEVNLEAPPLFTSQEENVIFSQEKNIECDDSLSWPDSKTESEIENKDASFGNDEPIASTSQFVEGIAKSEKDITEPHAQENIIKLTIATEKLANFNYTEREDNHIEITENVRLETNLPKNDMLFEIIAQPKINSENTENYVLKTTPLEHQQLQIENFNEKVDVQQAKIYDQEEKIEVQLICNKTERAAQVQQADIDYMEPKEEKKITEENKNIFKEIRAENTEDPNQQKRVDEVAHQAGDTQQQGIVDVTKSSEKEMVINNRKEEKELSIEQEYFTGSPVDIVEEVNKDEFLAQSNVTDADKKSKEVIGKESEEKDTIHLREEKKVQNKEDMTEQHTYAERKEETSDIEYMNQDNENIEQQAAISTQVGEIIRKAVRNIDEEEISLEEETGECTQKEERGTFKYIHQDEVDTLEKNSRDETESSEVLADIQEKEDFLKISAETKLQIVEKKNDHMETNVPESELTEKQLVEHKESFTVISLEQTEEADVLEQNKYEKESAENKLDGKDELLEPEIAGIEIAKRKLQEETEELDKMEAQKEVDRGLQERKERREMEDNIISKPAEVDLKKVENMGEKGEKKLPKGKEKEKNDTIKAIEEIEAVKQLQEMKEEREKEELLKQKTSLAEIQELDRIAKDTATKKLQKNLEIQDLEIVQPNKDIAEKNLQNEIFLEITEKEDISQKKAEEVKIHEKRKTTKKNLEKEEEIRELDKMQAHGSFHEDKEKRENEKNIEEDEMAEIQEKERVAIETAEKELYKEDETIAIETAFTKLQEEPEIQELERFSIKTAEKELHEEKEKLELEKMQAEKVIGEKNLPEEHKFREKEEKQKETIAKDAPGNRPQAEKDIKTLEYIQAEAEKFERNLQEEKERNEQVKITEYNAEEAEIQEKERMAKKSAEKIVQNEKEKQELEKKQAKKERVERNIQQEKERLEQEEITMKNDEEAELQENKRIAKATEEKMVQDDKDKQELEKIQAEKDKVERTLLEEKERRKQEEITRKKVEEAELQEKERIAKETSEKRVQEEKEKQELEKKQAAKEKVERNIQQEKERLEQEEIAKKKDEKAELQENKRIAKETEEKMVQDDKDKQELEKIQAEKDKVERTLLEEKERREQEEITRKKVEEAELQEKDRIAKEISEKRVQEEKEKQELEKKQAEKEKVERNIQQEKERLEQEEITKQKAEEAKLQENKRIAIETEEKMVQDDKDKQELEKIQAEKDKVERTLLEEKERREQEEITRKKVEEAELQEKERIAKEISEKRVQEEKEKQELEKKQAEKEKVERNIQQGKEILEQEEITKQKAEEAKLQENKRIAIETKEKIIQEEKDKQELEKIQAEKDKVERTLLEEKERREQEEITRKKVEEAELQEKERIAKEISEKRVQEEKEKEKVERNIQKEKERSEQEKITKKKAEEAELQEIKRIAEETEKKMIQEEKDKQELEKIHAEKDKVERNIQQEKERREQEEITTKKAKEAELQEKERIANETAEERVQVEKEKHELERIQAEKDIADQNLQKEQAHREIDEVLKMKVKDAEKERIAEETAEKNFQDEKVSQELKEIQTEKEKVERTLLEEKERRKQEEITRKKVEKAELQEKERIAKETSEKRVQEEKEKQELEKKQAEKEKVERNIQQEKERLKQEEITKKKAEEAKLQEKERIAKETEEKMIQEEKDKQELEKIQAEKVKAERNLQKEKKRLEQEEITRKEAEQAKLQEKEKIAKETAEKRVQEENEKQELEKVQIEKDKVERTLQEEKERQEQEEKTRIKAKEAELQEKERFAKETEEKMVQEEKDKHELEKIQAEKDIAEKNLQKEQEQKEKDKVSKKIAKDAEKQEKERIAKETAKKKIQEEKELQELEKIRAENDKVERTLLEEKERREQEEITRKKVEKAELQEKERIAKEISEKRVQEENEKQELEKKQAEKEKVERNIQQEKERLKQEEITKKKAEEAKLQEKERIAKETEEKMIQEEKDKQELEKIQAEKVKAERNLQKEKKRLEQEEITRKEAEQAKLQEKEKIAKETAEKRVQEENEKQELEKVQIEKDKVERTLQEEKERQEQEEKTRIKAKEAELQEKERFAKETEERMVQEEKDKHELEKIQAEKDIAEKNLQKEQEQKEKDKVSKKIAKDAEKQEKERIAKETAKKKIQEEKELQELEKIRAENDKVERTLLEEKERREQEEITRKKVEKAELQEKERIAKEISEKRVQEENEKQELEKKQAEKEKVERNIQQEKERLKQEEITKKKAEEAKLQEKERIAKETEEKMIQEEKDKQELEKIQAEKVKAERNLQKEKKRLEQEEITRKEAEQAKLQEKEKIAKETAEKRVQEENEKQELEKVQTEKDKVERTLQEEKERQEQEEKTRIKAQEAELQEKERITKETVEKKVQEEKELQESEKLQAEKDIAEKSLPKAKEQSNKDEVFKKKAKVAEEYNKETIAIETTENKHERETKKRQERSNIKGEEKLEKNDLEVENCAENERLSKVEMEKTQAKSSERIEIERLKKEEEGKLLVKEQAKKDKKKLAKQKAIKEQQEELEKIARTKDDTELSKDKERLEPEEKTKVPLEKSNELKFEEKSKVSKQFSEDVNHKEKEAVHKLKLKEKITEVKEIDEKNNGDGLQASLKEKDTSTKRHNFTENKGTTMTEAIKCTKVCEVTANNSDERELRRSDIKSYDDSDEHYIREYHYKPTVGPKKCEYKEKPRFVDKNHRDYTMEFIRPSGFREKSCDIERLAPDRKRNGRSPSYYKAGSLLLDAELRSSAPPLSVVSKRSGSERPSEVRQRSKAFSEARSVISESRSSTARDIKRKPVFSTYLTDRTAVESSRVKLTCSVLSSVDPKVTWFKNGVVIENKLKYRIKFVDGLITLEVLNAVPSDTAEYSCTVENENGSVSSSANLKVYPSFEASPIPPTFTRSIRDTYHLAENELVLECRIRGQPLPTITWMKEDKVISSDPRYQAYYLADGVCRLAITHPTPGDSGKYTCKAENSIWSDQITHIVNFTGRESRLGPNLATIEKSRFNRQAFESRRPHFSNVLTDHKVSTGGTIGLQVEIRGSPTRVEWLREGRSVTETYSNAKTFAEHGLYTLALSDVTETESGLFTCRAWSLHGNVDMNAAITVVQPNELEGKPAIIVGRPEKDILISVGEDINISFRVQGEPKPKVVFMKGIRDITNSQRVCKMTSDDYVKFTLKRSVISDAGTYCILARNAYGCDRAFVTVEVRQRASSENLISDWTYPIDDAISIAERKFKSVPERIPGEPCVVDGGNNWVSLSWPKPDPGASAPVLAYKVESWLLGKEGGARWLELGITPLNSFDAFNLKQGEEYHFRITPKNRYGWGESVQTSSTIGVGLAGDRPEFVDILPGQLKVLVGETANLCCSVKGNPVPEVVWMKNGHEIEDEERRVTSSFDGYNSNLTIKNIKPDDEARYSCESSNVHGRASTYARLAVVTDRLIWQADAKLKRERSADVDGDYPPQFTMRLRDRRVQATYPVRLTCQVVGSPPPIITWYKDGIEVAIDSRHSKSQDEHFHTLEIAPTNLEDGGVYEAMARNGCGAISCRCCLVVDKGIRAYVAPEFCCGLEPLYRLNEGDELRISAVVEAYPSVGVTWYRDGVRLRPSRRAIMTLDRDGQIELALASVTYREAGVYMCTASNEVGKASTSGKVEVIGDSSSSGKATPPVLFSPDVPYSKEPMFIRKPRSSEALEGDTVIIECEVVGDPKPDVYWLRDFLKPDYYRDATHFKRIGDGPEYRFEIPHAKFDYTGAYSVVARNVHGEAKAIISLQILARDPSSTEEHNVRYGRVDVIPRFERELTDLLCHDGDVIEFDCRVTGNPEPDIRWYHYSELIRDCSDFETFYEEGSARLRIKQVAAEDEGTYRCEAHNSLGKASSSACLVVYPPGEPNTLSQRLRRPPALLSGASTPRSTPRSTPVRSVSRTPGPDRRLCSPSRQMAPKFYTYPFNKVVEEGDHVMFQCAVKGLPAPWATWDKDGLIITPSSRITIKEKDEILRILEIEDVTIDDVGLYRVTLENDYGTVEASARLEVITQAGKFYAGVRSYSASPRRAALSYRRRLSSSRQD